MFFSNTTLLCYAMMVLPNCWKSQWFQDGEWQISASDGMTQLSVAEGTQLWWSPFNGSTVFQPGKSGFAQVLLQCFCYSWPENENSIQQKTFFWVSNVCFHFFSDLKLLTFFRMGEVRRCAYIPPKPSPSSGLDWDDSDAESFSLLGPWIKSRLPTSRQVPQPSQRTFWNVFLKRFLISFYNSSVTEIYHFSVWFHNTAFSQKGKWRQ